MVDIAKKPDVISCTEKSVGQRRGPDNESVCVPGVGPAEEGPGLFGRAPFWCEVRLTTGMVPDGTKSQVEDIAFGGIGGGAVDVVGAGVPCMGAQDDAIRVTGPVEAEGVLGTGE